MLCDARMGIVVCAGDVGVCSVDSHFFFSNFAYKADAMRRRFVFAVCEMGAVLMALIVVS